MVLTRDYPAGLACTKRVHQLLEYLVLKEMCINVISYRSKNEQPSVRGSYMGINYLNIGLETDLKLKHLHKIIIYFFSGISAIMKYRKRNYSNVLYCTGGISIENIHFILWSKILGYKIIFAIEEDYSFFDDKIKFISRFKYWTINRLDALTGFVATAIVVISTSLLNKYSKRRVKDIILIPITAKLNFDGERRTFNNPLQVVYAGTFGDKDGVSHIIEGFRLFNARFKDARLILIGRSQQQLIYKNKYNDRQDIVFKGYVPDEEFYPLLKYSDVLCMCRTSSGFANAGFPFKLGEYLATGNPVISTRVSDVECYLTGNDAYLVDPDNPQQICNALEEIVSNPDKARETGRNGLLKCKEYFSQERNGRLLYELIIKISGGRPS